MWTISFTTKNKGKIIEEGFDTSYDKSIDNVIENLDSVFDLIGIDEVEIKINKVNIDQFRQGRKLSEKEVSDLRKRAKNSELIKSESKPITK